MYFVLQANNIVFVETLHSSQFLLLKKYIMTAIYLCLSLFCVLNIKLLFTATAVDQMCRSVEGETVEKRQMSV